MKRAYSVLTFKAAGGGDARVISGVATTPTPDRVGDVIEPLGVKFDNPLPLLWQHRSDAPVGSVTFDKPTSKGIEFTAQLPTIAEPGPLKDRVDTAWGEIKAGLVRGVSVGFRALEHSVMDDGGIRFIESEVLELSLVTIPANADATIQTIKSFDTGLEQDALVQGTESASKGPAFREKSKPTPKAKEPREMKTTQERVAAFEAKRAAKAARMSAIMSEADDETLGADEKDEYDGLAEQGQGGRRAPRAAQRLLEGGRRSTARPVVGATPEEATATRKGEPAPIRVSVRDVTLPKGIAFARMMRCEALAAKERKTVSNVARQLYPDHGELHDIIEKTAVAAGTTTVSGWASNLVNVNAFAADFVEYLRPMTIIGQFGTNGVPALRRVPFRTILASQTAGTTGYWVGEGQPKPVSKPTFGSTYLLPYKVAAISVATMELFEELEPERRGDLA